MAVRRMPLAQLRLLIHATAEHQREYIENSCDEDNPQVIELRNKAKGCLDAAEAIEAALDGFPVLLRIMAGA